MWCVTEPSIDRAQRLIDSSTARLHFEDDDASNGCLCSSSRNSVCCRRHRGCMGSKMACQAALHTKMGIVAGPTRPKYYQLDVELKLNKTSLFEDSNQAAGLAIGGAGARLLVQMAGTRSRIVQEERRLAFFASRQLMTQRRPDCLVNI